MKLLLDTHSLKNVTRDPLMTPYGIDILKA